jgi:hypothetical protein
LPEQPFDMERWLKDHRDLAGGIAGIGAVAERSLDALRWLKAQAEQACMARDALVWVEWDLATKLQDKTCPCCGARQYDDYQGGPHPHKYPCRIDTVLTLMGLPDAESRDRERARLCKVEATHG